MCFLNTFKNILLGEQLPPIPVESRRRFLKGAAGVAAVAVVAVTSGYQLLDETEVDRLKRMIESGLVENQTFYLDRTAVIEGLSNVRFFNCNFINSPDFVGETLLELNDCSKISFVDCCFDTTKRRGGLSLTVISTPTEMGYRNG